MRATTPSVSSNHHMTRSTAHKQPNESGPSTKQAHSKERGAVPRVKQINMKVCIFMSHPRETKLESAISSFWKVLLPSDVPKKNESDIDGICKSSARKSMDVVTVDNLVGGTKVYKSVNQAGYHS
eukprot:scaffold305467_cov71-Attheya_sp.AAC.4